MRLIDGDKLLESLLRDKITSGMQKARFLDLVRAAQTVATDTNVLGKWISVKERLPDTDRTVLAVKQLKDGTRNICIARCIPDYEHYDIETGSVRKAPYWVCGGNNNIICWRELPELPEED